MFRVLSKINCVCVCLVLSPVVSQRVNTSNGVRLPYEYEEILFRVSDGIPAKLGTVPYQVSIKKSFEGTYKGFCGGGLIASNKILTAAHCFVIKGNSCQEQCKKIKKKDLKRMYAVAGGLLTKTSYKKDGESSEQWRRMKSAHVPPGFKFPDKDIAVVFTQKSFTFNEYVKALPYATKRMDYKNFTCIISGYGRISMDERSSFLLYDMVQLYSDEECSRVHKRNMKDFICIDRIEVSGRATQKGDSGGPLVCRNTGDKMDQGQGVIVGVVSGSRKIKGQYRSFDTRVSNYQDFVRKKATKNLPVLNFVWISLVMSNFVRYSV